MEIKLTTGTYKTQDYRVVKEYKSETRALKYLRKIGYPHNELTSETWTHQGKQYKLKTL
jgi:hypothetical protein